MPQIFPRISGAHMSLQDASQAELAKTEVPLACPAPPLPRAPGPLDAHAAQPPTPPHGSGWMPGFPHSPHCSSVPSGHCCSPSQSQGTGMQPAAQAAWREAAHVGLAAAAGKKEPGPGSGGAAAPGIHLHSPPAAPCLGVPAQRSAGRDRSHPGAPLDLLRGYRENCTSRPRSGKAGTPQAR